MNNFKYLIYAYLLIHLRNKETLIQDYLLKYKLQVTQILTLKIFLLSSKKAIKFLTLVEDPTFKIGSIKRLGFNSTNKGLSGIKWILQNQ